MSFSKNLIALIVAMPLLMVACNKKPKVVTCKADSECRFDASGKEINGFCYNGICQECVKDADCKDLKQCVEGRCLSACQSNVDCGADSHCSNNFCVENCTSDDACPSGESCHDGRCVSEAAYRDGDASANGSCENLASVHFDFDSFEVKSEYDGNISQTVACLEANPGATLTINGHTDNRGTPGYNMALAQRRADAVKAKLTSKGIASKRITTVSHGAQNPKVDESTEYAWQQNRRTEFSLSVN
jgi:peptidoglycan-associated lipoprotein